MNNYIKEVQNIFSKLDKKGIKYVVARNYQKLLENKIYPGKDIDICIEKKKLKKMKEIFEKEKFTRHPINPFSNHIGYIKFIPNENKLLFFHLHIGGVTGRHLMYLEQKNILKRRIKKKYLYVPSPEDEFLVILLHSTLDKNKFRKDYCTKLKTLWKNKIDKEYIKKELENKFEKNLIKKIFTLIEKEKFDELEKLGPKIKESFLKNYKFKNYNLFKVYFLGGIWKINNYIWNRPLISFIGMDGSGKTTTSKEFVDRLNKIGIKTAYVYSGRGRNNILPIQFLGKKIKVIPTIEETNNKEKESKNGKDKISLIHTAAAPIFALDLFLRYHLKIKPLSLKHKFVVTDRYTSDILLINKVPYSLKRFLYFILPKPQFTFYLYNTPEVLNKRKNHPLHDLKRQEKIFKKINSIVKPIKIKTDDKEKTLKEIQKEITKIIS